MEKTMNELLKEQLEKEFDKIMPCIELNCNGEGIIAKEVTRDNGDSDIEPEQCQFCYTVRFPARETFIQNIENILTNFIKGKII